MSTKDLTLVVIDVESSEERDMRNDFNNEIIQVVITSDILADSQTTDAKSL